jgi:Polyketide cyclase / dehydrase and lipid transport
MWQNEFEGTSAAPCDRVHGILEDVANWSEWNEGVAEAVVDGPFATGTEGVMTLPDGENLGFRIVAVEPGRGYTDETPIPGTEVVVRVVHHLEPLGDRGTRIVYRCEVEGPDATEIGQQVTADFPQVIAALARRAEESS